jgi:hypothetical protein
MAGTVRVRVAHGWAVAHDGEQHGGGAVLDVPGPLAQQWIEQGWAAKVREPAPSKRRSATSARRA